MRPTIMGNACASCICAYQSKPGRRALGGLQRAGVAIEDKMQTSLRQLRLLHGLVNPMGANNSQQPLPTAIMLTCHPAQPRCYSYAPAGRFSCLVQKRKLLPQMVRHANLCSTWNSSFGKAAGRIGALTFGMNGCRFVCVNFSVICWVYSPTEANGGIGAPSGQGFQQHGPMHGQDAPLR